MRPVLSLVAFFATLFAGISPAFAQTAPLEGLDAYIEKARQEWHVPGVVVAIVKDDKIVYEKGFGVRQLGEPGEVDPQTVFAIGSASKAFTGAALGMLVDENKIEWDGAVHNYIPTFELHDPFATSNATVRDLLSHRTGFVSGYGWLWTGSGFDRNEIIRRIKFQSATVGFRNRFQYANEMYTVAGEIIPAVTGKSWDDFIATRLFKPLGMKRSSTSTSALKAMTNVASPHGFIDGNVVPFGYRDIDNVGGAGAINSSAHDMAQWVRMLLNDGQYEGKRLISSAALAETRTGQMVLGGGAGAMTGNAKFVEYGLGWIIHDYKGKKVVQHGGAVDGMLGVVGLIPEERLGVVVLTNRLPHQLPFALELKIFDTFLGGEMTDWSDVMKTQEDEAKAGQAKKSGAAALAPDSMTPPPLPLEAYSGIYSSDLLGEAIVAKEKGELIFKRPTATAVLKHEQENLFRARWTSLSMLSVFGETPVGFTIGPDGHVAYLELGTDKFKRNQDSDLIPE